MFPPLSRWLSATAIISLLPVASLAQTNATWNGSTGNWSDATRWSTNPNFPHNDQPNVGDLYNAIINNGTVTLDQNIVIQGLTQNGGVINGANNLTLNAASTWSNGTMSGLGTTTFNGPLTLGAADLNRTVNNNGTATWQNANNMNGTGVWNNQNGAVFDIQNNQVWFISGSATINNQAGATFRKSAGTGTSFINWNLNNSGLVEANTGTLDLRSTTTGSSGSVFRTVAGSAIEFSGSSTMAAGSTLTGTGTFNFSGGTHTINGTWNAAGLGILGGTTNFNSNGSTTTYFQQSSTLQGSGNLIVNGASTWLSGTMSGAGTTTFNGPLTLGAADLNRTVNNNGTAAWQNANNMNGTGVWNNQNGAVFDIQNNQFWFGTGTINNQAGATFRKSAGTGTSFINWNLNNSGLVESNTGTLDLRATTTGNSGSVFQASAGATIEFSGSSTMAAGSTLTGTGTFNFSGTHTINGTWNAAGLGILGGTTNFNSNGSTTTYFQQSSILQGSGNLTVNGSSTWDSGTMSGAGTTTFNGPLTLGAADVNRTVNNNGTATWQNTNNNNGTGVWNNQNGAVFDIQNNQVWFGTGTINNQTGGTFRKSAGSGNSQINWNFNNAGTVEGLVGTLFFNNGFTQTVGSTVLNGGAISSTQVMNFNGGSLTGAGTITGSALFGNASIAPGLSPGILAFTGNLNLSTGSVLDFEVGTISDLITVGGNFTLDGTLNITGASGFGFGTFTLIDYSGSLTDNGLNVGSAPSGFNYLIFNDLANTRIDLVVTAIPEPSSILLGSTTILGGAMYVWCRRTKRRRFLKLIFLSPTKLHAQS